MLRNFLIIAILSGSVVSVASEKNILQCDIPKCKSCFLLIDLKRGLVEYMDNESSHFLNQTKQTRKQRVFEIAYNQEIPTPGFRFTFNPKSMSGKLSEISSTKSTKVIYTDVKCKASKISLSK